MCCQRGGNLLVKRQGYPKPSQCKETVELCLGKHSSMSIVYHGSVFNSGSPYHYFIHKDYVRVLSPDLSGILFQF